MSYVNTISCKRCKERTPKDKLTCIHCGALARPLDYYKRAKSANELDVTKPESGKVFRKWAATPTPPQAAKPPSPTKEKNEPAAQQRSANPLKVPEQKTGGEGRSNPFRSTKAKLVSGFSLSLFVTALLLYLLFNNISFITEEDKNLRLLWIVMLIITYISFSTLRYFYKSLRDGLSKKCPKCETWATYQLEAVDTVASWSEWRTRSFTDVTRDIQGKTLSTTTRQQQVKVDYIEKKYFYMCLSCGFSDSRNITESWVP